MIETGKLLVEIGWLFTKFVFISALALFGVAVLIAVIKTLRR